MAFFLPLIGGLSKVAGSQAMGQVAKKAIAGGAQGAARRVVGGGKGKGGKAGRGSGGGQGGPLVKNMSGAIVQNSSMMGAVELVAPKKPKKVQPKRVSKVSFESIANQLKSIESLTGGIEKLTGQGIKNNQKLALQSRRAGEKAKQREKEAKSEGGSGLLGKVGGALMGGAKQFGIFDFLKNILIGGLLLTIINLIPRIQQIIPSFSKGFHLAFLGIRGMMEAIKKIGPFITKGLEKAGTFFNGVAKPFKNSVGKFTSGIKNSFKILSDKLPKFIKSSISYAQKAGQYGAQLAQRIGQIGNTANPLLGKSNKALNALIRKGTGTGGSTGIQALQGALRIRRLHGDEAARMYQGMIAQGMDPTRAAFNVKKQINAKRLTSAPAKGRLGGARGGLKGSKLLKGGIGRTAKRGVIKLLGKGAAKGLSRIPVIGPLIVGITSYLETGKLDQSLFRAGGALLGGFFGTFIPIPILGTIVGELVGEYVGDLMYELIRGGGVEAVGQRLKNDFMQVLKAGEIAIGWVGDGFKRTLEGLPKMNVPVVGEIINPFDLMVNPLQVFPIVAKAFFTRNPMRKGDVKKEEKKEEPQQSTQQMMTEQQYYNARVEDHSLPATYEEYKDSFGGTQEGFRPGSDALADHSKIAPSSSQSKTEYNSQGGNNKRKIFLHWSAGHYTTPYSAYHTIFLGNGKAVRNTPYGVDKHSHTKGANDGSIGLSVAAMHGGQENASSWPTPPTQAQLDAMTSEAAQIAVDWGYSSGDVDNLIMTHGEWERYATKNGILPAPAQRWDLDKLKPSDPRIDTSKVKSHGGNTLRAKIKAKMAAIKNGQGQPEVKSDPSAQVTQQQATQSQQQRGDVEVRPTTPMAAGRTLGNISSMTDAQLRSELDPTMTGARNPNIFKEASAARAMAKAKGLNAAQTERLVLEATVAATRKEKGQRSSDTSMENAPAAPDLPSSTPPAPQLPPAPEISPITSSAQMAASVEAQAAYERFLGLTEDGGEATIVPVVQSGGGGGDSSSESTPNLSSSNDGVNSFYRAQVMGHLYKYG